MTTTRTDLFGDVTSNHRGKRSKPARLNNLTIEQRNELVISVIPLITSYLSKRMCKKGNGAEGYELYGEVYSYVVVAVVHASQRYLTSKNCKFSTYAYQWLRMAYNRFWERFKERNKIETVEYDDMWPADKVVRVNNDIENQFDRQEYIHTILGTLTPRQRQSVSMYYLDGMTHGEIAKSLSISKSRVRQLLDNGLTKLKKLDRGDI